MTNRVLARIGVRHPIVQAPMGWIARAPLASAVSAAGALGMIETSSGELAACRGEIAAMAAAGLPFGVNLPVMLLRDDRGARDLIRFLGEARPRLVTTSAGGPARHLPALKEQGLTVYHVVPSVRAAVKAAAAGADGLVVEGAEGGGFKNPDEVSLLVLLQAVRRATDVPLIAAGGIVDGGGMAAAFALGAEAVQMGTRFLSAAESPVHPNYKRAVLDADETGTVMVNRGASPVMRVLRTAFSQDLARRGGPPGGSRDDVRRLYFDGDMEASVASAGQGAGLIGEILSAADIVTGTMREFHAAVAASAAAAAALART